MSEKPVRLLFIDDEAGSVQPAVKYLENECVSQVKTFSEMESAIDEFLPEVIILDLLEGGYSGEAENAGSSAFSSIWSTRFCPIVIYSAQPDLFTSSESRHPFVRVVQKGRNSPSELRSAIAELRPQVVALRDAERHFRSEFARALRDVAPYAFDNITDDEHRRDTILRSARRRVAALMDDMTSHGKTLLSWEQYLCPPVSEHLQLGDVLRQRSGRVDDPQSYRVVLTPSCDLASSGNRSPKVQRVLVACCVPLSDGLQLTSLKGIKPAKLKERLPSSVLTQGFFESLIPFPALSGRIPHMAGDLRNLDLIALDSIGAPPKDFERIASIDSPFRELVAWAYLQIACRPGLPDRDFNRWSEEILASLPNGASGK